MPVLFLVSPLDPVSEERVDLRFANADDERVTGLGGEKWWPGLAKAPALSREAFNGSFEGAVALGQAQCSIFRSAMIRADSQSPSYRFAGAPVSIWHGALGDAFDDYELIFTGRVTDHKIEGADLQLVGQVDSEPFEASLLELKYAGTGGAEGVEDLKDKVRPALFGYALNVEPVMINTVDNVFQVHGYGPIEDIVMVYERASEFGAPLADYATYDLLVAATIPEGQWATCLAQGMFRLGAPPFGIITADVKGDNTGGFHQTTAAIIERLCDIAEVDSGRIDSASLAAFAAAVPYPINLYLTTPEKLIDLVQRLARPCNAQATLSWTGLLQVTRFGSIAEPSLTLDVQGRQLPPVLENAEQNVSPPYWRLEMLANRSWRVHTKDEIAAEGSGGQVTIYRRYPTQPATPTGAYPPADWLTAPPAFTAPTTVEALDQFGPVWQSMGFEDGTEWTTPVLFDSLYPGWWLISQNAGAKVTSTANGLKADSDFDPATDTWPYCFINKSLTGPWRLRCVVKGAADRIAAGVINYTPATPGAGFDETDFFDGFWIAQNDTYAADDGGSPTTGVFLFQDGDIGANVANDTTERVLDPQANLELEMVFNGETVDYFVDGERVRTHFIDYSATGMKFWAVFMPLSADAEIIDISWERATQSKVLEYPLSYTTGLLRRTDDETGWEIYAPEVSTYFPSLGYLESKDFRGGAFAKTRLGGGVIGDAHFYFTEDVGGFHFEEDGTFEGRTGAFPGTTVVSGSWADGDEFAIQFMRMPLLGSRMMFYKDGALIKTQRITPPSHSSLVAELGAGMSFYEMALVPRDEGQFQVKGSANDTTILTPILDSSPTVTGGYVVIAETGDIVFTLTGDVDDIAVTALFQYAMTAGAAASYTPEAKLQYSSNKGSSWSDLGSPSTGDASTIGSPEQMTLGPESQDISGSGTRRYRLLAKNTVAGTYSVDADGYLTAEWTG